MKFRNIISIVILTVYSIVIMHNFIPHYHHSEFAENSHYSDHHNHQPEITGTCCVKHSHNKHSHTHCTFYQITILTKSISLSDIFIHTTEIDFGLFEKNKESVLYCYLPIQIPEPHCRDVLLRGPPPFS